MESITQEHKVHFYEFLQIDLLHQYINTGINYFFNTVLTSDRFVTYRYYSDEMSSIVSMLKDLYFLIKHQAIYAENFYQLQRKQLGNSSKLSKKAILVSILLWHVLPYICRKIQKKFKQLSQQVEEGNTDIGTLKWIFVKLFPIAYLILNSLQTLLKFKYLHSKDSRYYNLQYHFSKISLDYQQKEQQQYIFPLFALLKSPGLFLLLISHKVASFFFNRNRQVSPRSQGHQSIKSPSQFLSDNQQNTRKTTKKQCPICGDKPKNPTMLKSSGYVFCYSCINQYIKKSKMCPITKLPADDESLQIIYN